MTRQPPNSPQAEQGVIGCILLDSEPSMAACAAAEFNASMFYDLRNQTVFSHCEELHYYSTPIDMITLSERLRHYGQSHYGQSDGIEGYLHLIEGSVPSAANIPYYLDIVIEKHKLRRLLRECDTISESIYQFEGSAADFYAHTVRKLESLIQLLGGDGAGASNKKKRKGVSEEMKRAV